MLFLMVPSFCLKNASGPNDVADVVGHIRSYIWSTDRYTGLAPGEILTKGLYSGFLYFKLDLHDLGPWHSANL